MKRFLLVVLLLLVPACSDEPGAERALLDAGYTNISLTGYEWFGCGKDDGWSTGFTATGPSGRRVEGVVCSGVLKGSTIRLF